MENEANPFLPKCPQCDAWPMAFSERGGSSWGRQTQFVCGQCATAISLDLRRPAPIYASVENSFAG